MLRALPILALLSAACAPDLGDLTGDLAFKVAVADIAVCQKFNGSLTALGLMYSQKNCPDPKVQWTQVGDITCENDALRLLKNLGCDPRASTLSGSSEASMYMLQENLVGLDSLENMVFGEVFYFACTERDGEGNWQGERIDLGGSARVEGLTDDSATLRFSSTRLEGTVSARVCFGNQD